MSGQSVASLSREALLAADIGVQRAWLEAVEPDYQMRAYSGLDFGLFYPHGLHWLEELRETHGEDFAEYLAGIRPPITDYCIQSVLFGGVVDATEAQAILDYVAEQDPDGWWSLIGWDIQHLGASVFVACIGRSEGQGGVALELAGVFADRAAAQEACAPLEIRGERMTIMPPVSLRAFWGNGDAESTLTVSGAQWERIQSGQAYGARSISFYEGEASDVYWTFKDGRVSIEDDESTSLAIEKPVSELLVTVLAPTSSG